MDPYQLLSRMFEQPLPGHIITVGVGNFMLWYTISGWFVSLFVIVSDVFDSLVWYNW